MECASPSLGPSMPSWYVCPHQVPFPLNCGIPRQAPQLGSGSQQGVICTGEGREEGKFTSRMLTGSKGRAPVPGSCQLHPSWPQVLWGPWNVCRTDSSSPSPRIKGQSPPGFLLFCQVTAMSSVRPRSASSPSHPSSQSIKASPGARPP